MIGDCLDFKKLKTMLFNGYFELKNIVSYRMRKPEVWNTLKISFKIMLMEFYSNVRFSCPIVWILWKTNLYLTFFFAICWYMFFVFVSFVVFVTSLSASREQQTQCSDFTFVHILKQILGQQKVITPYKIQWIKIN